MNTIIYSYVRYLKYNTEGQFSQLKFHLNGLSFYFTHFISIRSVASVLTMTAIKHRIRGTIVSKENTTMSLTIQSSADNAEPQVLAPLTADKPLKKSQKAPDSYTYTFTYWAKASDAYSLTPTSDVLLFYPPTAQYTASGGRSHETCCSLSQYVYGDMC